MWSKNLSKNTLSDLTVNSEQITNLFQFITVNLVTALKITTLLGDTGPKHLSEALQKNQTLTDLEIIGVEIGDNGTRYLSQVLQKNQNLKLLLKRMMMKRKRVGRMHVEVVD